MRYFSAAFPVATPAHSYGHAAPASAGLIGSSVGPLLFGVVAGRGGLYLLPAVMIGVSGLMIGAWLAVPKNRRRED